MTDCDGMKKGGILYTFLKLVMMLYRMMMFDRFSCESKQLATDFIIWPIICSFILDLANQQGTKGRNFQLVGVDVQATLRKVVRDPINRLR